MENVEMSEEPIATPADARPRGEEELWLFLHIPKTAGSSFRSALADRLQPDFNINIDSVRGTMSRDEGFKDAVEKFIALDKQQKFAFASGHLKMPEVVAIEQAAGRPVRIITLLRTPATRVVSEYRYQRTPVHSGHEKFREDYPTIESYVDDPRSQNKMFRHLALPKETLPLTIARMEKTFGYVGVVEMYPLLVKQCSQLIGANVADNTRLRVTPATKENAVEVTEDLLKKIRQLNSLDEDLWKHFRDRMRTQRIGKGRIGKAKKPPSVAKPFGARPGAGPATAARPAVGARPAAPHLPVDRRPKPGAPRPAAQAKPAAPRDQAGELAHLRRENARLMAECDILRKSIAILSKARD